ncbi:MAG: phosphatase PAP2 family protein [Burkholderiales bacterium]|uniref:phosphatase PAP2 family protein n=1 Tax=Roseateles sp. TaxID=1971397 RepID=UPI000FBC8ED6|nr:MAG: phosphatase PAP2 family protein [Burkholderiales bacterium]
MNEPHSDEPVEVRWSPRLWWAWAGVPALLLLGVLTVAAFAAPPARLASWEFQQQAVAWLYADATNWASDVWSTVTLLGDTTVALMLLAPVAMWRPQAFMAVVASIPVGGLVSVLGKLAFRVPRPSATLDVDGLVQVATSTTHLNSFPSGHSITAFAVVAALCASLMPAPRRAQQWLLIGLGLLAALSVGASRVALAQHWPLDVLAGGLCGWLAGVSGVWLQRRWLGSWQHERISARKQQLLLALLLANAAYLVLRAEAVPLARGLLWIASPLALLVALQIYRRRGGAARPGASGTTPLGLT